MNFKEGIIKDIKRSLGEDYKTDLWLLSALGLFLLFVMIWILVT